MIYLGDLVGLLLIALIVWWFWLSKAKAKHSDSGIIKIIVENGVYNPARIEINSSQPVTLEFLRNDTSTPIHLFCPSLNSGVLVAESAQLKVKK